MIKEISKTPYITLDDIRSFLNENCKHLSKDTPIKLSSPYTIGFRINNITKIRISEDNNVIYLE